MKNIKNNEDQNKPAVDLSRRRLTKLGIIASPILTTLPGKSALAGNCTTLSGMLSGNLSAQDGVFEPCDDNIEHIFGLSPGYWRTVCSNDHQFPFGYQIRDFFTDLGYGGAQVISPAELGEYTLLEILWLKNKHIPAASMDVINFARHTVAALFSAITSPDYFIGPEQIIHIYNDIVATGVYVEPVTNEQLFLNDIIAIYESSYVGVGAVTITDNDTFIDCHGYKYDDRDGKGHLYIQDLSGGPYYRMFFGGTVVNWGNH